MIASKSDQSIPKKYKTKTWEAALQLIKANLGPGCLNLPFAFAQTGALTGGIVMLAVSVQGIYCMWLLSTCKTLISKVQQKEHPGKVFVYTLMDVTAFCFGAAGKVMVQVLLVIMQGGVCCVYVGVISRNLISALDRWGYPVGRALIIPCILAVLAPLSLIRQMTNLKWTAMAGNLCMVLAVITVVSFASFTLATDAPPVPPPPPTSVALIAPLVSSLYYAFEGMALVLPVENSMNNKGQFPLTLGLSMGFLALIFIVVGSVSSMAFPDINDGSITSYLVETHGDNVWFQAVNFMVMLAVVFTYPLQLYPVLEALNSCRGQCCLRKRTQGTLRTGYRKMKASAELSDSIQSGARESSSYDSLEDGTNVKQEKSGQGTYSETRPAIADRIPWWAVRRVLLTLCFGAIAGSLNSVAQMVALFGAIGTTGLVIVPCAMHIRLQHLGIAPKNVLLLVWHCLVILISLAVLGFGSTEAIQVIINENVTRPN